MFTLDVLDTNISHMEMFGYKDLFMSLPIIRKEDDAYQLACITWQAKKGQQNVPRPEHVITTTLKGNDMRIKKLEEFFPDGKVPTPDIIGNKYPVKHTLKNLAGLMDSILFNFLTTGAFSDYEYIYYLERLYPEYTPELIPVFTELNMPKFRIDITKGICNDQ